MLQVTVREEYAEILAPLQVSVDDALHKYALDKTRSRILELEQRLATFEERYGCSYDLFAYRTAMDEAYVRHLDEDPTTQEWEGDQLAWEFDAEELREWRHRLQMLSIA
jgi:hypothetical protein